MASQMSNSSITLININSINISINIADTVKTIDNAKVYVSSDFSTARESGGDTVDFVYDLDFTNY